jgi:hypothetical protein
LACNIVITLVANRRNYRWRAQRVWDADGFTSLAPVTGGRALHALRCRPVDCLGDMRSRRATYGAIAVRRALRQTDYEPVWQDWFWFTALPNVYAALTATAIRLRTNPQLRCSSSGQWRSAVHRHP